MDPGYTGQPKQLQLYEKGTNTLAALLTIRRSLKSLRTLSRTRNSLEAVQLKLLSCEAAWPLKYNTSRTTNLKTPVLRNPPSSSRTSAAKAMTADVGPLAQKDRPLPSASFESTFISGLKEPSQQ